MDTQYFISQHFKNYNLTNLILLFFVILCAPFTLKRSWVYFTQNKNKRDSPSPPGPSVIPRLKPVYPLIGNYVPRIPSSELLKYMVNLAQAQGKVIRFQVLHIQCIIINSAPIAETLLKSGDYGHVTKGDNLRNFLPPFIDNGVLQSDGEYWKMHRRLIMRSQKYSTLKHKMSTLHRYNTRLVNMLEERFKNDEPQEIFDLLGVTLLGIITEILTGSNEFSQMELLEFLGAFKTYSHCLGLRGKNITARLFWKLHPASRLFAEANRILLGFTERRLAEYHRRTNDLEINNMDITLLEELIKEGMTKKEIMTEINTMIFGGHDTTLVTLQFFLMFMATYPEIQAKCRMEVDQVFESNPVTGETGTVSWEVIQTNLKYVERCLLETLRIYPPAYILGRKLTSPLDIKYNGRTVRIPVGWHVHVSPFIMHRNEEYYKNPELFDPDRFLPNEVKKRHPYAYIPFSAGPRNCLGQKFGMLQLKTVTAYILKHFEIDSPDKLENVAILPNLTLESERNYKFVLRKR